MRAFEQQATDSIFWNDASTIASGLRVPKALGDFLVLRAVRERTQRVERGGQARHDGVEAEPAEFASFCHCEQIETDVGG